MSDVQRPALTSAYAGTNVEQHDSGQSNKEDNVCEVADKFHGSDYREDVVRRGVGGSQHAA